jgi:hypothetical protein
MTANGAFIETMNPNRINVTVRQPEGQCSYLQLKPFSSVKAYRRRQNVEI